MTNGLHLKIENRRPNQVAEKLETLGLYIMHCENSRLKMQYTVHAGASIPMGQGDMSPP